MSKQGKKKPRPFVDHVGIDLRQEIDPGVSGYTRGWKTRFMTGLVCIAALKALAEETRLRILRLLLKEQLNVTEISERLKVSPYNTSKHLRVMREAGLLEIEKHGQQRLYRVAAKLKSQMSSNNDILDLGCCTFRLDKLPK
jgi:DNA-binding transcriptional ArsR family regulator